MAEGFGLPPIEAMRKVVENGLRLGVEPARIEAARRQAGRFDWVAAADEYLALYRRLLGR